MLGGIVCCRLMERTFELQWAIQIPSGATNLRRAGCVTRWGCAFERAASAGGVGRMPLVSGMTSQSSRIRWYQFWSRARGVRRIGAIKAPPQPISNALVWWRPTQTPLKYSSRLGAGRRPSTSNWAILSTVYRHDFLEHQTVFGAIVVLTQLSFVANPLFQVAY